MLDQSVEYIENNRKARCYFISDGGMGMIKGIYDTIEHQGKEKIKKSDDKKNNEEEQLSNDFKVLLYIYEQTEIEKRNVYYSRIVEETKMGKRIVSKAIFKMLDISLIYGHVAQIEDGYQAYCFFVDPDFLSYVHGLYNVKRRLQYGEENEKIMQGIKKSIDKKKIKNKQTKTPKQTKNEFN